MFIQKNKYDKANLALNNLKIVKKNKLSPFIDLKYSKLIFCSSRNYLLAANWTSIFSLYPLNQALFMKGMSTIWYDALFIRLQINSTHRAFSLYWNFFS